MSMSLTPEQETEARKLAEQLKDQAGDSFLAIARLLVAADESNLFGEREFAVRRHALELLGQAYTAHLAGKKTATAAHPSTVRTASKRRRSRATASEPRKASEE